MEECMDEEESGAEGGTGMGGFLQAQNCRMLTQDSGF